MSVTRVAGGEYLATIPYATCHDVTVWIPVGSCILYFRMPSGALPSSLDVDAATAALVSYFHMIRNFVASRPPPCDQRPGHESHDPAVGDVHRQPPRTLHSSVVQRPSGES